MPDKPEIPPVPPAGSALSRWWKSKRRAPVIIKQLQERDRRRMLKHFMELDDSDRLLRFGTILPDEQVVKYVGKIDFSRDVVLGVYNNVFKLVAVGHLASGWGEGSTFEEREIGRAHV